MIWLLLMMADVAADPFHAEVERAPAPVRRFIERRAGCNHWAGEEPYDADRAREIAGALRSLRCSGIEIDEAALRRRYAAQARLIALIDATADADGW